MFETGCLILGFLTIGYMSTGKGLPKVSGGVTWVIIILAIIGIYLAPYGFDRKQYLMMFQTPGIWDSKDLGWESYLNFFRMICGRDGDLFFLLSDTIYTLLFGVFAYKVIPKGYRFFFLLLLFISLGYYSGGTNIMRAGLTNAIIYAAIGLRERKWVFLVLAWIATTIHMSSMLVIVGLVLGYYFPKIKWYTALWLVCLALSPYDFMHQTLSWVEVFIGDGADRLARYAEGSGTDIDLYVNAGWRLDFIIYSTVPLLFAWLYKTKWHFENRMYDAVLSSYLISNAFWLIFITIPYADRIALLSWIFIPIITLYPPLVCKGRPDTKRMAVYAFAIPIALHTYFLLRHSF